MSDVDGIFDKPPSQDNSRVIHTFIPSDLSKIEFGAKSNVGTGGNYYYEITNFLLSFFCVFFSRGLSLSVDQVEMLMSIEEVVQGHQL